MRHYTRLGCAVRKTGAQSRRVGIAGGLGVSPGILNSSPFLARKGVRGMVEEYAGGLCQKAVRGKAASADSMGIMVA